MSFLSKKPLVKQTSIFDNETKIRPSLPTKRVSFDSTVLSDSDEENSLGRTNIKPLKTKYDDDDLLNMFKNELSDSEDDVQIGSNKKKDKPNPKPRHKSELKIKESEDDNLLQTKSPEILKDELEQTINPKRKPRPQPRKNAGDSEIDGVGNRHHEISQLQSSSRQETTARERPISTKPRQNAENKQSIEEGMKKNIPKYIINDGSDDDDDDDDDDDIIITTTKKGLDKSAKKDLEISSFANQGKKEKDSILDTLSQKLNKKVEKPESLEEDISSHSKETKKENQIRLSKNKSMLSKSRSISLEDDDDDNLVTYKKEISTSKLLATEDTKIKDQQTDEAAVLKRAENNDSYNINIKKNGNGNLKDKPRYEHFATKLEKNDGDELDNFITKGKGNLNIKKNGNDSSLKLLLDDQTDLKDKPKFEGFGTKLEKNDSDELDNFLTKRKSDKVPPRHPRKGLGDDSKRDSSKTELEDDDSDLESEEEAPKTLTHPVPKTRKDLNYEECNKANASKMLPKPKLHFLDKDDNDGDETHTGKSPATPNRLEEKDDQTKSSKTSGWSSLDDSDDDESVGKKINLFGKSRLDTSSMKMHENEEVKRSPKPRQSPKPKPRQTGQINTRKTEDRIESDDRRQKQDRRQPESRSEIKDRGQPQGRLQTEGKRQLDDRKLPEYERLVQDRKQTEERRQPGDRGQPVDTKHPVYSSREQGSKFNRYTNQNIIRDTSYDEKETMNERNRIHESLRPNNKNNQRHIDWTRDNDDITHMFEEHAPDTSDVVDGRMDYDSPGLRKMRDTRRPQSAVTHKKGPMKAEQGIEKMTRSPQLRDTARGYEDHYDSRARSLKSLGRQKASSLTNLHQTGTSDYRNLYDSDDDQPRRNSLDTESIRQTVYDNWLSRKNVTIKKELSQKALQKQREAEKAKEEEERKRSAQLAFKSWNEHKAETIKEKQAKIKEQKKQDKDKQLEKELKTREAAKYFESWKSKKDVVIKETRKEKKKEENMKKKKENEDKMEKTISSKKSFDNWKSRKDEILKKQFKEKRKTLKLEESKKEDEDYEKTIKNADEFQKWVNKKGKPRKKPPSPTLSQRAWVPGSRNTGDCIPGKVQPVIVPPSSNRARTLSGSYRGRTKYYDY